MPKETPDRDPENPSKAVLPAGGKSVSGDRGRLAELAVASLDRALWNLRSILKAIGEDQIDRLFAALAEAADPDSALDCLERTLTGSYGFPKELLEEGRLERLTFIFGAGEPMADLAEGHLVEMTSPGFADPRDPMVEAPTIGGADETARLRSLSRWHRRELLRIVCCELDGGIDVEQTGDALSELADLTVRAAFQVVGAEDLPMGVVALGKWGGRELNFSSDIDLYFLRDDDSDPGPCELAARGILRVLSGHAGTIPIYRTDLRLRPGGVTGPLVPTISQARSEFHAVAGTWERIVHIRSRAVHDGTQGMKRLLNEVAHFVFQRPFDLEEIQKLQGWKEVLESSPAGKDDSELKVGWGGIRDVEYLVQFLQLLHGQVHRSIRGGNIYHSIRRLGAIGALTPAESARVLDGYRFLRRVEHHCMLQHRRQSFNLPEDPVLQRALSRSLGFASTEELFKALDLRRDRIRSILESLFHTLFRGYGDESSGEVHVILAFEPKPEVIDRVFGRYAFRDPRKAYQMLRRLAFPRQTGLRSPRARHYLAALFPVLLDAIKSTPDPDQAALMFVQCVETLGAPAIFYKQLTDRPETCRIFVDLFGRSRYLSELLLNHPGVLDEVVDRVRTVRRATLESLLDELRSILDGVTNENEIARRIQEFRALHFIHIGILDLSGRLPLDRVLVSLSTVARAILKVIDEICLQRTMELMGDLQVDPENPARHTILALGRLGGDEVGYASDLDLILVHDGFGTTADGQPERVFWSQHLKAVTEMIGRPGTGGPLYEVDLRLRPDGAGGALVSRFDEFRDYFLGERSQLWEHQALVRSSAACGDAALATDVMQWINEHLGRHVEPEQIALELGEMHERRRQAGRKTGIDFRTGPGGLIDIEFLVQSLVLRHHRDHPEIRQPSTAAAISALAKSGVIESDDALILRTAYHFLRLVENRLSMMHRASIKAVSEEDASLRELAIRIGFEATLAGQPEERLRIELDVHTDRVQEIFHRLQQRNAN